MRILETLRYAQKKVENHCVKLYWTRQICGKLSMYKASNCYLSLSTIDEKKKKEKEPFLTDKDQTLNREIG